MNMFRQQYLTNLVTSWPQPENSFKSYLKCAVITASLCSAFLLSMLVPASAKAAQVVERGKFIFYDTKQVAGEESSEVTRDGGALIVKSSFALPSLELEKPLTAMLRVRQDLTPERFEIAGVKPSKTEVDTSIEIKGRTASLREGKQTR